MGGPDWEFLLELGRDPGIDPGIDPGFSKCICEVLVSMTNSEKGSLALRTGAGEARGETFRERTGLLAPLLVSSLQGMMGEAMWLAMFWVLLPGPPGVMKGSG